VLNSGDALSVEIDYQTHKRLGSAIFSISISQEDGENCIDVNTTDMDIPCNKLKERGTIKLLIDRLDLRRGKYFVDVGIYKQDWSYAYDYHWQVYPLTIDSLLTSKGLLHPPMRWEEVLTEGVRSP
jgi:lipopolysaccharide transport system ATP-binding protein